MDTTALANLTRPATTSQRIRTKLMGSGRAFAVFFALGLGAVGCDGSDGIDPASEDLAVELDELCGDLSDDELLTCVRAVGVAPEQAPATNHADDEPSQGFRVGEVTGYSLEHSVGFIQSGRTTGIYVHSSELAGGAGLEPGDRVSFELMIEPDGFAWAKDVQLKRF